MDKCHWNERHWTEALPLCYAHSLTRRLRSNISFILLAAIWPTRPSPFPEGFAKDCQEDHLNCDPENHIQGHKFIPDVWEILKENVDFPCSSCSLEQCNEPDDYLIFNYSVKCLCTIDFLFKKLSHQPQECQWALGVGIGLGDFPSLSGSIVTLGCTLLTACIL